jgi:exopolysaccharide production protein ExoQ
MSGSLAISLCLVGIAGLFYLDRDTFRTSKALWLPVIWFWIVGSRPVSFWLGGAQAANDPLLLDGSPTDRNVFLVLLVAGIIVLIRRRRSALAILKANGPILAFFAFGLLSVLWSSYPDITIKRWIKAIGDLVMVFVLATDANPNGALRRFLARTGFFLLPLSFFCIRYLDIGRGFDPDGYAMNTGLTTNKNVLGVVTFVLSLGALWRILTLLRARSYPNRGRHLLAQVVLLAFGIALLSMAHSATSQVSFALGAVLMITTGLRRIRRSPAAVHAAVMALAAAAGIAILSGGMALLTHAVGRQENFTGRTEIWNAVFRGVDNPLVGAGFESFWLGSRLQRVWSGLSQYMHVNEAHNGYLEEYLNLGWVGLALLAAILITGYGRAVKAFRYDYSTGGLMLALAVTPLVYNMTEAGFRMLNPMWISMLVAQVGALRFTLNADSGARDVSTGSTRRGGKTRLSAVERGVRSHQDVSASGTFCKSRLPIPDPVRLTAQF